MTLAYKTAYDLQGSWRRIFANSQRTIRIRVQKFLIWR